MSKQTIPPDDRSWLRSIVRQYEGPLMRYAARLLGDQERARDVVQETLLKLCRQPRSKIENEVRPWLFAVCRNHALDVLKKEQRMSTMSDECAGRLMARTESDPSVIALRQELVGRAVSVLETLPGNQQEVIRLKVQNGLSYREISQATGLSVSNVGFLIHKGMQAIRLRMAESTTN